MAARALHAFRFPSVVLIRAAVPLFALPPYCPVSVIIRPGCYVARMARHYRLRAGLVCRTLLKDQALKQNVYPSAGLAHLLCKRRDLEYCARSFRRSPAPSVSITRAKIHIGERIASSPQCLRQNEDKQISTGRHSTGVFISCTLPVACSARFSRPVVCLKTLYTWTLT